MTADGRGELARDLEHIGVRVVVTYPSGIARLRLWFALAMT
jgi:hypothetical protein